MRQKCTILVNSCDAYKELWEPFFLVLKERWNPLDYNIVLNTETESFEMDGLQIHTFQFGKETKGNRWGGRLLDTLKRIDTEYVISVFDDFILESDIDDTKIRQCIDWMDQNKEVAVFYLMSLPQRNQTDDRFEGFDLVPQGQQYRLNSAPAIWRRKKLIEFTGKIDSPWAWEVFGTARTFHTDDKMYCVKREMEPIYHYNHKLGGAIHRGKWVRSVIEPVVQKYDLDMDLNKRGFENEGENGTGYTLKWKINFIIIGIRMVGMDAFKILYKMLLTKFRG